MRASAIRAIPQGIEGPEELAPGAAGFGPHLVFDGHGCARARLDDLERLYTLLHRLPDDIGMTRIMPPYVFRHRSGDTHGISGFVLIAESHISLHTFPEHGFLRADVFSCMTFEVERVLVELRRAFAPRRSEWHLFDRGREFPKTLAPSRAAVIAQRRAAAMKLGLEVSR